MFAVGSAALDPRRIFPVGLGDFSLREKVGEPDWGFFDPQAPRLLSETESSKEHRLRGVRDAKSIVYGGLGRGAR